MTRTARDGLSLSYAPLAEGNTLGESCRKTMQQERNRARKKTVKLRQNNMGGILNWQTKASMATVKDTSWH